MTDHHRRWSMALVGDRVVAPDEECPRVPGSPVGDQPTLTDDVGGWLHGDVDPGQETGIGRALFAHSA